MSVFDSTFGLVFGAVFDSIFDPYTPAVDSPAVASALLDLYLVIDSPDVPSLPVTLDTFIGGATPRLIFVTVEGEVFDTDGASVTKLFDDSWSLYRTIRWYDSSSLAILTVLFNAAELTALIESSYTEMAYEVSYRNVDLRPPRVLQLVSDGVAIDDLTYLQAGYNTHLDTGSSTVIPTIAETGIYPPSRLTVNIIPGAGEGRLPKDCTEDSDVIRRINGVGPDDQGDLTLSAHDCYWWRPLDGSSSDGSSIDGSSDGSSDDGLELINDCQACVSCNEIATLYERLVVVYNRAQNVNARLLGSKAQYDEYVTLLEAFKTTLSVSNLSLYVYQTTDENFDIVFRMQTGNKRFRQVQIDISYGDGFTTAMYQTYSGRRKLPGLAPATASFTPGSGSPLITETFTFEAFRYASWYWNMEFSRADVDVNGTAVSITWTARCYEVDENDIDIGTVTFSSVTNVNIVV